MKEISSPCIGHCELNSERTHCKGCKRSLAELSQWGSFSEKERKFIISQLKERDIANAERN
tara:strand:+ start:3702 stop:3884 length:183 start_codon:yes stop_codon:yes gene_type:complete